MLNKKLFKEALEEIEEVFDGFNLTESKIKIWYKYSKILTDDQWNEKIKNCIRFCRKIPTLADILDLKGYYKEEKDWSEVNIFEEDNYKYKSIIPPKIKERIHKVLNISGRNKVMNKEDRDLIEETREKVDKDYIIKKEESCET